MDLSGETIGRYGPKQKTVLHFAAKHNNVAVATLALRRGIPIDIVDRLHMTPLLECLSYYESTDVALFLLEKGADPNIPWLYGTTPLHTSVELSSDVRLEMTRALLQNGARTGIQDISGETPLSRVARAESQADLKLVRMLLAHDAWVFPRRRLSGFTALHGAALANDEFGPMIVRRLNTEGIDVDTRSRTLLTPLMLAAGGRHATTKALLECGADPNLQDSDGETALFISVERGHEAIALLLLEHGARTDLENVEGETIWDIDRPGLLETIRKSQRN